MSTIAITIPLVILLAIFLLYSGKQKKYLHYRKARPEEADKLRELGLLAYSGHKEALGSEWIKMETNLKNPEFWSKLINSSVPFVCEDYNKIVGMAFLIPSGTAHDVFEKDWCVIRMVGVDPAYSGKGISKKLTELCIDEARETNEHTIALHTSEFMNAARHVYEGLGFKILKEIPPRFGKRYWIYKLDL